MPDPSFPVLSSRLLEVSRASFMVDISTQDREHNAHPQPAWNNLNDMAQAYLTTAHRTRVVCMVSIVFGTPLSGLGNPEWRVVTGGGEIYGKMSAPFTQEIHD